MVGQCRAQEIANLRAQILYIARSVDWIFLGAQHPPISQYISLSVSANLYDGGQVH